jgi:hypothetical protein
MKKGVPVQDDIDAAYMVEYGAGFRFWDDAIAIMKGKDGLFLPFPGSKRKNVFPSGTEFSCLKKLVPNKNSPRTRTVKQIPLALTWAAMK